MSRMNCIVKIRGQLFEIEADGDWGGGDQGRAIDEVEQKIRAMSLMKIVELHVDLSGEQLWSDEPICDPIRRTLANPPEDEGSLGATLHIRAVG